jgi:hypothetical protein
MKHLKRFNEGLSEDDFNELKKFCESCLAYLLDDGLEIEFNETYFEEEIFYDITLFSENGFYWNQIKDDYIPFIQLLSSRYEIVPFRKGTSDVIKIGNNSVGASYYTYDNIIKDNCKNSKNNDYIMVIVRDSIKQYYDV